MLFSSRGGNSLPLCSCVYMFSSRRTQNSLSRPEIPSPHAPPTSRQLTPPPGGPSGARTCWLDPLPRGVSAPGWPLPTPPARLAAGSSQHLPEQDLVAHCTRPPHTLCRFLSAASQASHAAFLIGSAPSCKMFVKITNRIILVLSPRGRP